MLAALMTFACGVVFGGLFVFLLQRDSNDEILETLTEQLDDVKYLLNSMKEQGVRR